MKGLFKILLLFFACTQNIRGNSQNLNEQLSLCDSLKNALVFFAQNSSVEVIKKKIAAIQATYNCDINDSISKQLLSVEKSIIEYSEFDLKTVESFGEILSKLFYIKQPYGEHPDYATQLNYLGHLYEYEGQYEKAIIPYEQAIEIKKKVLGEENADYATSLDDLGIVYAYISNKEKSFDLISKALQIRKRVLGEESLDYALSLGNLGELYYNYSEYAKAQPLYEQSLGIMRKLHTTNWYYGSGLINLSSIYRMMGEYDRSLPLATEAVTSYEKSVGKNNAGYAKALANLADLYNQMGEYSQALPLYQQALQIVKNVNGEEHANYATYLGMLGAMYQSMGDYEKALSYYEKASPIIEKSLGLESPEYAYNLDHRANILEYENSFEKALALYQKALEIRKKIFGINSNEYASSLNQLAQLYKRTNKIDSAWLLFNQVLETRRTLFGTEHPDYASTLKELGNLYFTMEKYDSARIFMSDALSVIRKKLGTDHPEYADCMNDLAMIEIANGRQNYSSELLLNASTIKLKNLLNTYTSLSEQEKLALLNKESYSFFYLPSMIYLNKIDNAEILIQAYNNTLVLKGMVLKNQRQVLNNIRKNSESGIMKLYTQWRFNKALVGKQMLLPASDRLPYLDSLQEVTNQQEEQLSRSSVSFRDEASEKKITQVEIADNLSNGEAAIEFIQFQLYNKKWTDSTIYAALLLLPRDTIPKFIPLFEEGKLRDILEESAISQLYPRTKSLSQVSITKRKTMYNLIWQPLEKYLTGINTVYYAPGGLLNRIAFNALYYDSSHFLIDKYTLIQVLGTREIVLKSNANKPVTVSLWGDIQYDFFQNTSQSPAQSIVQDKVDTTISVFNFYTSDTKNSRGGKFSKLPGTKLEVDSIYKLCGTAKISAAIVSDTTATEEAFKALDGKSPQILHLATHGFFLPVKESKTKSEGFINSPGNVFSVQQNPMLRSGLVLAGGNLTWEGKSLPGNGEDGIITAYEVAQMDLANTDIVVLSACKTASGDINGNEGVIGLQRAFKMAGIKQMLISLWNIPDQETIELMTMFYKNLIAGQSPQEALRSAQLFMKTKYQPYDWAGFVLVE